ncbi:MAG: hypothetical protein LUD27_01885 [Clostridia bacterium]|nr:hypothetical protein [Clostridia bacterium]
MWKVTPLYINDEKFYTAYLADKAMVGDKKRYSPYGCRISEEQAQADADKLNKEGR